MREAWCSGPINPGWRRPIFTSSGASSNHGRFGVSADLFLIDHSNEQVYIPDDGSFEFKGPSRAYGYRDEGLGTTHASSFSEWRDDKDRKRLFQRRRSPGLRGQRAAFCGQRRADAAAWQGWSGSLRMRAINHYRLDGEILRSWLPGIRFWILEWPGNHAQSWN